MLNKQKCLWWRDISINEIQWEDERRHGSNELSLCIFLLWRARQPQDFTWISLPELHINQRENTAKLFMDQWDQLNQILYYWAIYTTLSVGELHGHLMPYNIMVSLENSRHLFLLYLCCWHNISSSLSSVLQSDMIFLQSDMIKLWLLIFLWSIPLTL